MGYLAFRARAAGVSTVDPRALPKEPLEWHSQLVAMQLEQQTGGRIATSPWLREVSFSFSVSFFSSSQTTTSRQSSDSDEGKRCVMQPQGESIIFKARHCRERRKRHNGVFESNPNTTGIWRVSEQAYNIALRILYRSIGNRSPTPI